MKKAMDFVGAKQYYWEDEKMEEFLRNDKKNPEATYYPVGELVITQDFLLTNSEWRVA